MRCQSWASVRLAGCREAPPLGAYLWELSPERPSLTVHLPCSESGARARHEEGRTMCEAAETPTNCAFLWCGPGGRGNEVGGQTLAAVGFAPRRRLAHLARAAGGLSRSQPADRVIREFSPDCPYALRLMVPSGPANEPDLQCGTFDGSFLGKRSVRNLPLVASKFFRYREPHRRPPRTVHDFAGRNGIHVSWKR